MPPDSTLWNWGDSEFVIKHRHVLDLWLSAMIEDRLETIRRFPWRFARPGQSCLPDGLILALAGYSAAQHVCACTLRFGGRRCTRWQVCVYCGYIKEKAAFTRFAPVGKNWRRCVSVTICPDVGLQVGVEADVLGLMDLWDQLHEMARSLVTSGQLAGMWWGEHFLPRFHFGGKPAARCWPHLHGVGVLAEGIVVADLVGAAGVRVHCANIGCEAHFKNLLDYVVAVPAFADAYREAWQAVGANVGSAVAGELNQAVRDVVGAFEDAGFGRQKFRTAGVLHPRHRQFAGATAKTANPQATAAWLDAVNTQSEVDLTCD